MTLFLLTLYIFLYPLAVLLFEVVKQFCHVPLYHVSSVFDLPEDVVPTNRIERGRPTGGGKQFFTHSIPTPKGKKQFWNGILFG